MKLFIKHYPELGKLVKELRELDISIKIREFQALDCSDSFFGPFNFFEYTFYQRVDKFGNIEDAFLRDPARMPILEKISDIVFAKNIFNLYFLLVKEEFDHLNGLEFVQWQINVMALANNGRLHKNVYQFMTNVDNPDFDTTLQNLHSKLEIIKLIGK